MIYFYIASYCDVYSARGGSYSPTMSFFRNDVESGVAKGARLNDVSHQNRSPGTDFGKKIAKNGPPDQFWLPKVVPPLPKMVPLGDQIWQTYMLAKIGPPSKTESLYPAHACILIMYTRLGSSYSYTPTEALTRPSQLTYLPTFARLHVKLQPGSLYLGK